MNCAPLNDAWTSGETKTTQTDQLLHYVMMTSLNGGIGFPRHTPGRRDVITCEVLAVKYLYLKTRRPVFQPSRLTRNVIVYANSAYSPESFAQWQRVRKSRLFYSITWQTEIRVRPLIVQQLCLRMDAVERASGFQPAVAATCSLNVITDSIVFI